MSDNLQNVLDCSLDLIAELKEYILASKKINAVKEPSQMDIVVSEEMSKLTVKLTSSISWLFLYKALQNKEITPDTLIEEGNALIETLGKPGADKDIIEEMPENFVAICSQAEGLYGKVREMHKELIKNTLN